MTNTSNSDGHFADRGVAIQSQLMAAVQSQAVNLAVETEFSSEDIVKLLLGAQIFALVDFTLELGLPKQMVYDIMTGAFDLKDKHDKPN